jgi:1-acyl-sn-glycerol-3-phosphate acyltransferase
MALIRSIVTYLNGVLATLVASLSAMIVALVRPRSRLVDHIAKMWARACLWPSGVHLEVRGREHVDPSKSYVVISNHQSTFDIMAHFVGLPVPIRFLAKKELFSTPFLGWALKAMDMVPVDRTSHRSFRSVETGALRVAELGKSIMVYAEGTRTIDGSLLPFKKGAFAIAVHTGLPVLPTTIYGADKTWKARHKIIDGGPITMVIGEPIQTSGLGSDDIELLRDQVKQVIQNTLDDLDKAQS